MFRMLPSNAFACAARRNFLREVRGIGSAIGASQRSRKQRAASQVLGRVMDEWLEKSARMIVGRKDGALEFHIGEAVMAFEPATVARLIERSEGGPMSIVYSDDLGQLLTAVGRVCAGFQKQSILGRTAPEDRALEELVEAFSHIRRNNPP